MFCIWCGSAADGDITLRCTNPACERTHYLNSKVSASALVVAGDTYLAVRRAAEPEKGKWDLPGGFTNYGEDPADTAARETVEESGFKIAVSHLLGVYMDRYREPDGTHWPTINLIYLAYLLDPAGDPSQVDATEISDIAWHELLDPPADVAFPTQQLGAIDAHLSNRGSTR